MQSIFLNRTLGVTDCSNNCKGSLNIHLSAISLQCEISTHINYYCFVLLKINPNDKLRI